MYYRIVILPELKFQGICGIVGIGICKLVNSKFTLILNIPLILKILNQANFEKQLQGCLGGVLPRYPLQAADISGLYAAIGFRWVLAVHLTC